MFDPKSSRLYLMEYHNSSDNFSSSKEKKKIHDKKFGTRFGTIPGPLIGIWVWYQQNKFRLEPDPKLELSFKNGFRSGSSIVPAQNRPIYIP